MNRVQSILDSDDVIFGHTMKALKFYYGYFKSNKKDVLFVSFGQPNDDNAKCLLERNKDFKIFQ